MAGGIDDDDLDGARRDRAVHLDASTGRCSRFERCCPPYGSRISGWIQVVVATPRSGGVWMGRPRGWASAATGRPAMRSPGRPPVARREHRQRFWAAIAAGLSSEDAAVAAGVSPAVGTRWFRESGGMAPVSLAAAVGALLVVRGAGGDRAPARPGHRGARDRPTAGPDRRRRSRGSCVATPRPAAAVWTTGPRLRSGMPTGVLVARRWPSSPLTTRCGEYVQDRLAGKVTATGRARRGGSGGARGSGAGTAAGRTGGGPRRGARSRSPTGCGSTSPMMSRCGSRTRRSTRRCTSRAAARCAGS